MVGTGASPVETSWDDLENFHDLLYNHSMKFTAFKQSIKVKLISSLITFLFVFSSPAHALSVSKEREVADEFMREIRKQYTLIRDLPAQHLVEEIGRRFVRQLPPQSFDYSFYIVDDEQFNAFAGPGANIFLNRGLITKLNTVDEVAGILGHEIAHSSCRHVADMIDRSTLVNIGTLAGILAGVLIGATGGSSEAAQAVIATSAAGGINALLSYSRENEAEADQKGLSYMEGASFSPEGLLKGLEQIRNSDWYGMENLPSYLKTHPGTTDRIIYIQSWITDNYKNGRPFPENGIDPFVFDMVKYRLMGLYTNENEALKFLQSKLVSDPDNPALNYGMAVLCVRQSRNQEAIRHLRKALMQKLFDPLILVELARIYGLEGDFKKSLEILEGLQQVEFIIPMVNYYKGEAFLGLARDSEAEKSFESVVRKAPFFFPRAYYHLAKLSGDKKDEGLSHYYLGLYYKEIDDFKNAGLHFRRSLKLLTDPDKKAEVKKILDSAHEALKKDSKS